MAVTVKIAMEVERRTKVREEHMKRKQVKQKKSKWELKLDKTLDMLEARERKSKWYK